MLGIDFSSQRPNIDLPCLPTHWIVNDTGKDNETKTRRPAGNNSCLKKSRKYQLRRHFVGDQRSCNICLMEEATSGPGTLSRRCGHARGSLIRWLAPWYASLRSADSSSCAGLPRESWERQNQASEILWCLRLRPLVKRPWTLQASQDLLNSPFFLDVPPMPWLSQAALIFLAAPCQASLSCLTRAVDAPVVPSSSRGPRPLLLYGLFSGQQQEAPGTAGPQSATALLNPAAASQFSQIKSDFLSMAWSSLIWCHPQLLLPFSLDAHALPIPPTIFSFQTPGNLFLKIFTSPYFTWLSLWSSMTLSEVLSSPSQSNNSASQLSLFL